MVDLDQLDLYEKKYKERVLTLEADEKLILITGTYCEFENRTVVGQCKMMTSKGRTFGIVFYHNNFSLADLIYKHPGKTIWT